MKAHRIATTSFFLAVGILPMVFAPAPAQAGASDRDAYYYRQKSWAPVEFSGRIKDVKQVPVHGIGSSAQNTVVMIEPDRLEGDRTYRPRSGHTPRYPRVVDLGESSQASRINSGDRIMVRGTTRRINETPVVMADSFQINDGQTIEVRRDPAFRKGYIWGRPLIDKDVYEYQNIDIDNTDKWYFDSYEYMGYPYRQHPPGASAPWARNEDEFNKRRTERFQDDQRHSRRGDRYQDEYQADRSGREDRSNRRQHQMEGISKSDQQLKRDVENEMTWSPSVDADKVQVTVRNGVVTLNGQVEDQTAIDDVIENAYDAGAKQVISKLTTEQ